MFTFEKDYYGLPCYGFALRHSAGIWGSYSLSSPMLGIPFSAPRQVKSVDANSIFMGSLLFREKFEALFSIITDSQSRLTALSYGAP